MKAMILCAGLGTRLRPLTERWPKPVIPLLGVPLLRFNLAVLRRAGVTAVGINTHHLPEEMARVAQAECERVGVRLAVVHEPSLQGTGGGIRGLRPFLQEHPSDGPFIVLNGDILFAVELREVLAAHQASGAAATLVLLPMPEGEKYASVEVDGAGAVRRIAGHGPGGVKLTPWHFSGVHVMNPEVFDFMSPSGEEDINRQVYPRMIQQGRLVRGQCVNAYWSDLGTPSRYLAAQRDLLLGQVPRLPFEGVSPLTAEHRGPGHFWLTEGAYVEGAVAGPALFDGCRVDAGSHIGSAVYVGKDAQISRGARLNRVAVMEGTRIAGDEVLVDVIAFREHRISAPILPAPLLPA